MALWNPQGVHFATHNYKNAVYTINATAGTHPVAGARLFYLYSGTRKVGADAPPGPQDVMMNVAFTQRHEFYVAFDVNVGAKAFGSYPSAEDYFRAIPRFIAAKLANTGYEIIRANRASRLYLDVEWVDEKDGFRDPQIVIPLLITELITYLKTTFQLCATLTPDSFCISRSRNPSQKQSYHIYLWDKVVFTDNHTHLRAIMYGFFLHLVHQFVGLGRSELDPIFFKRTSPVRGGGTIIDLAVYTKNRQLRPIGAVKAGAPERVLVAFDIAANRELIDPYQMEFAQWSRYLASPPLGHGNPVLSAHADLLALLEDRANPVRVDSEVQNSLIGYFTGKMLAGAAQLQLKEYLEEHRGSIKRSCSSSSRSVSSAPKRVSVSPTGQIDLFESKSLDAYLQEAGGAAELSNGSNSDSISLFSSLLEGLQRNSRAPRLN